MGEITEINITEAVIHILDNNGDSPVLNEYSMELNDEIYGFISKHLEKTFKDEELRPAEFIGEDNEVLKAAVDYFKEGNLLEASKKLANRLFNIMKDEKDIPSCDLLVCTVSTDSNKYLAIMKMDYIRNYTHNINFVQDKIGIDIVPQVTILPNVSQKVSKCAFINIDNNEGDYGLTILDRKATKEESFFTDRFLFCKILTTDREHTKNFVNAAENFVRKNIKENADYQEKIRSAVKQKLKSEDVIDVNDLSCDIFKDQDEIKEDFMKFVYSKGVEEKINVDKDWIDKKFKRVRLKVDKDMDIYINEEVYNDSSRFNIERNGDGSINIVIKNVKNYIEK